jgi:methyl-accepting chemotaxis protein
MKTTVGTRFGIGTKLIIGLGTLIGISVIVGALAIISMLSIQGNSANLSQQLLPETLVVAKVERYAQATMFDVRGYWMSKDEQYLTSAQASLQKLEAALAEAEVLAQRFPGLELLKQSLPKLKEHRTNYVELLDQTQKTVVAENALIAGMSETAKTITEALAGYVDNQRESLDKDLRAGAKGAALAQRVSKLQQAYQMLLWFGDLRLANAKTQLFNDSSYIQAALPNVDKIDAMADQLLKETNQQVNVDRLSLVIKGLGNYRQGVDGWVASGTKLDGLAKSRVAEGNQLTELSQKLAESGLNQGQDLASGNSTLVAGATWTILVGLVASLALGIFVAIVLIKSITGPLNLVTNLSRKITKGDFAIERTAVKSQDELGLLTQSFYDMVEGLRAKATLIESIANGVLTNKIPLASDDDGLGRSMQRMQESLNEILTQVNVAVDQMASGSDQVSTAAQSLSQGATEQASSLEEISASANEIHSQSKQNAENAMTANQLAKQASQSAQQGNQQMKDLMALLEKMTKSSEETKTIVKTIDDIAFQVNLLALNANVEAARAGKYGKGFAVGAVVVRTVGVGRAAAVNETTRMVEESIRNIQDVNATALKTGDQLNGILGNANKVADFLEEIAASSQEQAKAMGQINGGLDQIDQVTQSNTASAEESASASEELSGQAQQLKVMVSRFQLSDEALQKAQSRVVAVGHTKNVRSQTSQPSTAPAGAPSLLKKAGSSRSSAPNDIILNDDFDTF